MTIAKSTPLALFIESLGRDAALGSVVAVVKRTRKSAIFESADDHAISALAIRANRAGAYFAILPANRIAIRFR